MPTGLSIHVGLNTVDPDHYTSVPHLPHCVRDAEVLASIAIQQGFGCYILTDEDATSYRFLALIEEAIGTLRSGDILFLTFSGHGSFVRDVNGDERDRKDETLLFYDRMMLDDELRSLWPRFVPGVRIVFVCDSCHSGTIGKSPSRLGRFFGWWRRRLSVDTTVADETYKAHAGTYNTVWRGAAGQNLPIGCSVLILTACQDDEVASAGRASAELSLFTEVLLQCWDNGAFPGNYQRFYDTICHKIRGMRRAQHPNLTRLGPRHPGLEEQKIFSI